MTPSTLFHPAVDAWFSKTFAGPTKAQAQAWPAIKAGRHVLVAAPTGSGKTLAAFLAAIDDLVRQGVEGALPDETSVVYVSPLKALSNDIQRNLEAPLAGIRAELAGARLSGRRNPHAGPHRRYAAERAREHAPPAAADRRHDAGVAVRAAGLGVRPQDALDDADGDRRRDPCARPEQAGKPSRAVAGAPRRADADASGARGLVGHAEADRGDRALPRRDGGRRGALRHRRCRTRARARSRPRASAGAARGDHVGRSLAAGVRAACRAHAGASHHARLRQHAAHGGTRGAASVRARSARMSSPRTTGASPRSGGSTPSSA